MNRLTYYAVERPDDLASNLREAFSRGGPNLILVRIDPAVPHLIG